MEEEDDQNDKDDNDMLSAFILFGCVDSKKKGGQSSKECREDAPQVSCQQTVFTAFTVNIHAHGGA